MVTMNEKRIDKVLSEWLVGKGYECFYNFPLGGKFPDIIAIKGNELIAFELKTRAVDITTAMGQCLFYLNCANKVFIALPLEEENLLSDYVFKTLEVHGIGLLSIGKNVKPLVDAKEFNKNISTVIKEIRKKSNKMFKIRNNVKSEVLETLSKHPEGLTTVDIAKYIGMSRHSVTNYVYELLGRGLISQRNIGTAKLCYLKENKHA